MQGLILAAGVARRLYPITEKTPKCLLDIGGKPILSHQLDALRQYNVNEITIVLGYFKEMVVNYIIDNYPDMDFTFIANDHFFETNTSYSVYLCSEKLVSTETVLMNGDVLYPHALLKRIIESQFDSVLAVDVKECGREEVKVIEGDGNRLVAIGKELIQENSLGEFIGVAKLSKSFCIAFSASLSRLIDAGGKSDYFEAAILPLLDEYDVYYEDVSDLPCIEIDFAEDLDQAQELVQNDLFQL